MKGKYKMLNESKQGYKTDSNVVFMQMKNGIDAHGLYVKNGVFIYEDNGCSIKSYLDTGIFMLFEGSQTVCTDEKFKNFIINGRTTKNIIFQSRNAAAQFVLGNYGNTGSWE